MLIRVENGSPVGAPISDNAFRSQFPNVSFPRNLSPADIEGFGYGIYEYTNAPVAGVHEKAVESTPTQGSDGVWQQAWEIVPMSPAEEAEADDREAKRVRALRSSKLAECDWTQLPDAPGNTAAWAAYRQELRDITSQAGFPWNITWPINPDGDTGTNSLGGGA